LRNRFTAATQGYAVRPTWTTIQDVPANLRGTLVLHCVGLSVADGVDGFRNSCPWYFMFKNLNTGSRSPSPEAEASTSRQITATTSGSQAQDSTTTKPSPPAKAANPFQGLRPMPIRPDFSASTNPTAEPTTHLGQAGPAHQIPIEIDSDSETSSCVMLIEPAISKSKKPVKKAKSYVLATGPADSRTTLHTASG
jgi:hypothetical protein